MVELIINDDYRGVYMLSEKIKRDKNRIILNKPTSTDLSGGYLIEINFGLENLSSGWTSNISYRPDLDAYTNYSFNYPRPQDISAPQATYIEEWMHDLEEILVSSDYADPEIGYPSKIDLDSWVDYILINELSRDVDAYIGSTFLLKKSDREGGKLHAGPVWDHNLSYGNSDYCGGQSVEGLAIEFEDVCQWRVAPIIFANVWQDPLFRKRAAERWFALRKKEFGAELFNSLESLGELLRIPAIRNFERWPVLDKKLWPNAFIGATYQDDLQYLGTWITLRLKWLDQIFSEELQIQLTDTRSALISPNPTTKFNTSTIDFFKPLEKELEIQITNIYGVHSISFTAPESARRLPIPADLPTGTYLLSFQLNAAQPREFYKIIVH